MLYWGRVILSTCVDEDAFENRKKGQFEMEETRYWEIRVKLVELTNPPTAEEMEEWPEMHRSELEAEIESSSFDDEMARAERDMMHHNRPRSY